MNRKPLPHRTSKLGLRQRGAAILTAMLLVTLVASLSAAAMWQQWRGLEVESAERARLQSAWILQGTLDWARLILREDGKAGGTDHLAEPWSVPLQEARLSTFLASARGQTDTTDAMEDVFLSGRITDMQGRLNVMNLVQEGRAQRPWVLAFSRLFNTLQIPPQELNTLIYNLQVALEADTVEGKKVASNPFATLLPRTVDQLAWLGLSPATIEVLRPHITVLPEATAVNLNTASAIVLHASIPTLDMAGAQKLVAARTLSHMRSLTDAIKVIDKEDSALGEGLQSVNSRFFEVTVQLRLGQRVVQERALIQRDGTLVKALWRQRGTFTTVASVQ
jgi:general secretion pathway protein K